MLTVSSACFRINCHRFNYPGDCNSRLQSPALSAIEWLHQTRVVEKGGQRTKVWLAPGPNGFIYASSRTTILRVVPTPWGIQGSPGSFLGTFHPLTMLQNHYSDRPGTDTYAVNNWCKYLGVACSS